MYLWYPARRGKATSITTPSEKRPVNHNASWVMALALAGQGFAQEFSSPTIDLGVVVSDVEKSAAFYTKVIGFKEQKGFTVSADFAATAGLTEKRQLNIRVFTLGEGPGATKLKLMQVEGGAKKPGQNAFIESQLGFRYLTIMVSDTAKSVQRATEAGAKPIASGSVAIPKEIAEGLYLTIYKDPDGNFVELVGPKK